jgi:hypothetical protein
MYSGEASVRLSIFQDNESLLFLLFGNASRGAPCVYTANVRLFMTGDLAFYSTVLGKENMSGSWDYACDLRHSQWQEKGHEKGEEWTIEKLKAHRIKL